MSKRNRKRTVVPKPAVTPQAEPASAPPSAPAAELPDEIERGEAATPADAAAPTTGDNGGRAPDAEEHAGDGNGVADATADRADATSDATVAPSAEAPATAPAKRSVWNRLYRGETTMDFVGRRRIWFGLSLAFMVISVVSFATRGLNLGIDFDGGVVWVVPAGEATIGDARDAVSSAGLTSATITELESDEGRELRIESEHLPAAEADQVGQTLADLTGSSIDDVSFTDVSPTWGREISDKAVRALIVFMVLVTIYISFRFEPRMALATLIALLHDVVLTVGVYSVTQLEVTPATVIAVLTILGYSIYDTIVVFDKVDENTRLVSSTGGLSYSGMVNVSLNQTLMRSISTTVTSLLPVGSLLVIGSWIMGATVLQEFAVALLIGLLSGAYSSLFIASPTLAVLKEREPRYRDIRRRIDERGGDAAAVAAAVMTGRPSPRGLAGTTAGASSPAATAAATGGTVSPSGRVIPPRPRKKTGKRR